MIILTENLPKVKRSFEQALEKNNIMDLEFPFFNAYVWLNDGGDEVIFSAGYRSFRLAQESADTSHFDQRVANASENNVKWLGILDCSRAQIEKYQ